MEITHIESFLPYLKSIHERTMRVARVIPADNLDWTYAPGKFTLGDLLRHLATIERYLWAEIVQGKPSRYQGCGRELADGYDNVLAFVERLHAESVEIFSASPPTTCRRNRSRPTVRRSARGRCCAWWWSMKSTIAARSMCIWECWA